MHHHELTRLPGVPRWFEDAWAGVESYQGAFAKVVPHSANEVLKFTCCEATNELFRQLHKMKRAPGALPAVLEGYGKVASDNDGLVYHAWRLERLFPPGQDDLLRNARVHGFALLGHAKPSYSNVIQRLLPPAVYESLVAALTEEQSIHPDVSDWRTSERIAFNMGLRTSGDLREAFVFLLDFIHAHQCGLDLLTGGNILVSLVGTPVLGDPVCAGAPDFGSKNRNTVAEESGFSAIAMVPVAVEGFNVQLNAQSTGCLDEHEAFSVCTRLEALGLATTVVEYAGPEHQRHLRRPDERVSAWTLPDVARHLRSQDYVEALNR